MKKCKKIAVISLILLGLSCSKKEDSNDDNSQPLVWEMDGRQFKAEGGSAREDSNATWVTITPHPSDCSSDILNFAEYLSIYIPKSTTNGKFNVVFNKKGGIPMNALNSRVNYKYTDTHITVTVEAKTSAGHKAEGTFTVPYCKK